MRQIIAFRLCESLLQNPGARVPVDPLGEATRSKIG